MKAIQCVHETFNKGVQRRFKVLQRVSGRLTVFQKALEGFLGAYEACHSVSMCVLAFKEVLEEI